MSDSKSLEARGAFNVMMVVSTMVSLGLAFLISPYFLLLQTIGIGLLTFVATAFCVIIFLGIASSEDAEEDDNG